MSILLVEDETDLSDLVGFILQRAGHSVLTAKTGESGLQLWRRHNPELIVLDVGLPGISGWDVCRSIRADASVPIVFLTANDDEEDIVHGLSLGADDYITKPFSPKILQAKVAAVLRRFQPNAPECSPGSDLLLNPELYSIELGGKSAHLTSVEFRVLEQLKCNIDHVVPHDKLIHAVWGYDDEDGSKLLKGHIHNLRQKLTDIGFPGSLGIVAGVGYILSTPPEDTQVAPAPPLELAFAR